MRKNLCQSAISCIFAVDCTEIVFFVDGQRACPGHFACEVEIVYRDRYFLGAYCPVKYLLQLELEKSTGTQMSTWQTAEIMNFYRSRANCFLFFTKNESNCLTLK